MSENRYPFVVNAGLLFGVIYDKRHLLRLYNDQQMIAESTIEEAKRCIDDGLRQRADGTSAFGEGKEYTGQTLGEWLAAHPEAD